MARRKAKTAPPSGANTGPFSAQVSASATATKPVGHTAAGRPKKRHPGGKKRR